MPIFLICFYKRLNERDGKYRTRAFVIYEMRVSLVLIFYFLLLADTIYVSLPILEIFLGSIASISHALDHSDSFSSLTLQLAGQLKIAAVTELGPLSEGLRNYTLKFGLYIFRHYFQDLIFAPFLFS